MPKPVRILTTVCMLILLVFIALIVRASMEKSIGAAVAELVADGWGVVTLVDLYAGLFIIAVWIAFVEGSLRRSFWWIIALIFLGNLATLAYIIRRALRAETIEEVFIPRRLLVKREANRSTSPAATP